MPQAVQELNIASSDIAFQDASVDIWQTKYQLCDQDGDPVDQDMNATYMRVADALAGVEKGKAKQKAWREKFIWALQRGAIPAGRVMSNAGAEKYKPATSTINCFAGETPVLTKYGIQPMESLVGKTTTVLNGAGEWSDVEFQHHGKQKVYSLLFRYANEQKLRRVRATKNHRWILDNGSVVTTEYWLTTKLSSKNRSIRHIFTPVVDISDNEFNAGLLHGLIYGDGSKITDSKDSYNLPLIGQKEFYADIVKSLTNIEPREYTYSSKAGDVNYIRFNSIKSSIDFKSVPDINLISISYLAGFISGIIGTDGTVYKRLMQPSTTASLVAVYGDINLINFVEQTAPLLGIATISKRIAGLKGQLTNLGERKRDLHAINIHPSTIPDYLLLTPTQRECLVKSTNGDQMSSKWILIDVEETSEEVDVYCCEEPKTSSFVIFGGLQTGNCTVSGALEDSMDDVLSKLHEAGLTLKAGCGIGYEFSSLRPKDAYVSGAGAYTSGPLSFMDIFDKMCFTVSSAGGRRGAQMATFDVGHPDVVDFIKAKREDGRLRQFNLSLLITEAFVKAVVNNELWPLSFPLRKNELTFSNIDLNDPNQVIWRDLPYEDEEYIVNNEGYLACKITKTIPAKKLWDIIMSSTYDFAEPGFILIDKVNEFNNNWFCESIRVTNPCLHPDSIVETVHGRVRIADIKEPTKVYTMLPDGSLGIANASAAWISKRNAQTLRISTGNGKFIRVTPEHLVCIHNGITHDSGTRWVRAQDLKIGDRVVQLCRARRGVAYSGVKLTTEDNRAYRMEHVMIANACYGVDIDEDVHHLNGDTYANWIDNLEVMHHSDHSRHTALMDHPQSHQVYGENGRFVSSGRSSKTIIPMPEELRSNMKNNCGNKIISIQMDEVTDVYDLTVEGTHNFIADFSVVHNCGEQPLPPYGSCLLGSINLTKFVKQPFTSDAYFDWDEYRQVVRIFTRMLDNVVEINGLPLEKQRQEIYRKRRHGMGFLGLGSTITMLGMKYGDAKSIDFTSDVSEVLAIEGWREALELAKEKNPAPIMNEIFTVTGKMLRQRPEMVADGYKVGDLVPGRILHAKYSRYMQKLAEVDPQLVEELANVGARFTHHSSIAPTGTISLSLANNASNGIEPSFAHHYSRNVIRQGKKSKERVDVFSFELLAYRTLVNPNAMPYTDDPNNKLPDNFITTDDIAAKQHVDIQAAAQHWIDSSISKTINVPTDYPYEDFKNIYMYGSEKGLKGTTTFRFNPEAFQGVLVKEADLENTIYQFTLANGEVIEVKGNEEIEYDGEMHSAANLYDSLKEGYYGKF